MSSAKSSVRTVTGRPASRASTGSSAARCSAIVGHRCGGAGTASRSGADPTPGAAIRTAMSASAGPATLASTSTGTPSTVATGRSRSATSRSRRRRAAALAASAAARCPASGADDQLAGGQVEHDLACRRPRRAAPDPPPTPAVRPATGPRSAACEVAPPTTVAAPTTVSAALSRSSAVISVATRTSRPDPARGTRPASAASRRPPDRPYVGRPRGQRRVGQRGQHAGVVLGGRRHGGLAASPRHERVHHRPQLRVKSYLDGRGGDGRRLRLAALRQAVGQRGEVGDDRVEGLGSTADGVPAVPRRCRRRAVGPVAGDRPPPPIRPVPVEHPAVRRSQPSTPARAATSASDRKMSHVEVAPGSWWPTLRGPR